MLHCEPFPCAADQGCLKLYPNHTIQMETAGSWLKTQVICIERLSLSLASAGKSSILFFQEVDITSLWCICCIFNCGCTVELKARYECIVRDSSCHSLLAEKELGGSIIRLRTNSLAWKSNTYPHWVSLPLSPVEWTFSCHRFRWLFLQWAVTDGN
jgi:hypothetical protein